MRSINATDMKCSKCNGTGFIEGFMHVSQGTCFDCNGSGSIPESKKRTKKYSKSFIDQFRGEGFFPESLQAKKLFAFAFIGSPTAEFQVLKSDQDFYIGQPVCRASGWYKVPFNLWVEFITHYNKVFKERAIDMEVALKR